MGKAIMSCDKNYRFYIMFMDNDYWFLIHITLYGVCFHLLKKQQRTPLDQYRYMYVVCTYTHSSPSYLLYNIKHIRISKKWKRKHWSILSPIKRRMCIYITSQSQRCYYFLRTEHIYTTATNKLYTSTHSRTHHNIFHSMSSRYFMYTFV